MMLTPMSANSAQPISCPRPIKPDACAKMVLSLMQTMLASWQDLSVTLLLKTTTHQPMPAIVNSGSTELEGLVLPDVESMKPGLDQLVCASTTMLDITDSPVGHALLELQPTRREQLACAMMLTRSSSPTDFSANAVDPIPPPQLMTPSVCAMQAGPNQEQPVSPTVNPMLPLTRRECALAIRDTTRGMDSACFSLSALTDLNGIKLPLSASAQIPLSTSSMAPANSAPRMKDGMESNACANLDFSESMVNV